jgi:hypothetical protein
MVVGVLAAAVGGYLGAARPRVKPIYLPPVACTEPPTNLIVVEKLSDSPSTFGA